MAHSTLFPIIQNLIHCTVFKMLLYTQKKPHAGEIHITTVYKFGYAFDKLIKNFLILER